MGRGPQASVSEELTGTFSSGGMHGRNRVHTGRLPSVALGPPAGQNLEMLSRQPWEPCNLDSSDVTERDNMAGCWRPAPRWW